MKALIISDIHHNVEKASGIISKHHADTIIFLGDYFDDFDDDANDASKTARWLRDSVMQPNRIHLLGNHDIAYMFPNNPALFCSGWNRKKSNAISKLMTKEHWDKMKLCHHAPESNILFSHAGVHPGVFDHPVHRISVRRVGKMCEDALGEARAGGYHPALWCGRSRGGRDPYSGVLWCDWNSDFIPLQEFKQVVGHTPNFEVREKQGNFCIDTKLRHIGWLEGKKFWTEPSGL